ncbi:lysophospholipid acyltransferase family protein [Staphylococcus chromogenes]|nr:lysophospholipid acyltransferase family protein [Staphylococcus chromogenes]
MATGFKRHGMFYVPVDFAPETKHWSESREPVYGGVIRLVRTALKIQGIDVFVQGMENLPLAGGALFAFNHTGYYDFILGGVPSWIKSQRLVRFMTKREIFDVPLVRNFMRGMKHISVDRSAGAAALEEAIERINDGQLVGIFPEATISRSFEVKDLKNGAIRIASTTGAPLIPVTIWGSQRIWTKGQPKNLRHPNVPVLVRVGKPLELTGDVERDLADLHRVMQAQLDDVRAEYNQLFGPFEPGLAWMPASLGGTAPTLDEARQLEKEDRERREAERTSKRERTLGRLNRIADAKANLAMGSAGFFEKLKLRLQLLRDNRRGS